MLNKEELLDKIKEKSRKFLEIKNPGELNCTPEGILIDFNDIPYIRLHKGLFIINKHTAKSFFNIAFEDENDEYLEKIIEIFNIYAHFDYFLYTPKDYGFNVFSKGFEATYIERKIKKEPEIKQKEVISYSNLCKEISLGPMMECTLGMKNTAYSYKELYENVIYPQFQEMLRESIGLEITHMSQFDDQAFELLKMARI
jgi:hypothetical protein